MHFEPRNRLLGQKCTFSQKVRTWRPPVPFVYRTCRISRLLDPGIAEIRKSAHFLYFCSKSGFLALNQKMLNFRKIPNFCIFHFLAPLPPSRLSPEPAPGSGPARAGGWGGSFSSNAFFSKNATFVKKGTFLVKNHFSGKKSLFW